MSPIVELLLLALLDDQTYGAESEEEHCWVPMPPSSDDTEALESRSEVCTFQISDSDRKYLTMREQGTS